MPLVAGWGIVTWLRTGRGLQEPRSGEFSLPDFLHVRGMSAYDPRIAAIRAEDGHAAAHDIAAGVLRAFRASPLLLTGLRLGVSGRFVETLSRHKVHLKGKGQAPDGRPRLERGPSLHRDASGGERRQPESLEILRRQKCLLHVDAKTIVWVYARSHPSIMGRASLYAARRRRSWSMSNRCEVPIVPVEEVCSDGVDVMQHEKSTEHGLCPQQPT